MSEVVCLCGHGRKVHGHGKWGRNRGHCTLCGCYRGADAVRIPSEEVTSFTWSSQGDGVGNDHALMLGLRTFPPEAVDWMVEASTCWVCATPGTPGRSLTIHPRVADGRGGVKTHMSAFLCGDCLDTLDKKR